MSIEEAVAKAKGANCYLCKWRKDNIGDAHSQCAPANATIAEQLHLLITVLTIEVNGERVRAVLFDKHGIEMGWANWPLNFDPVWLRHCYLFTPKEEKDAS